MQALKIIVDKRERNLQIVESLSALGVVLEFAQLPVGDYVISDRMCIERKTASDFESSIMDNRLFEQAERLKSSFEKPIIIIEEDKGERRLTKNMRIGAMLRLYTDYNVQMFNSDDAADTAMILSKFAEKEQVVDNRKPRILGIKKAYTTYQWQALILSSMPGIGPNLAHRLLEHFKTIRNVATAEIDDLTKVEKIGKKKATAVYGILNSEFEIGEVEK